MILSQTIRCASRFGDARAIELLAQAGFDAIDYSFLGMCKDDHILNTDGYKEYAFQLSDIAIKNNIYFNQAHGVTGVSCDNPDDYLKLLTERNIRALEICYMLGIDTLVVHPIGTGYTGHEEQVFDTNMKYFHSLIPYAEGLGIKLACENMWRYDKRCAVTRESVCGNPYEHARYIDEIGCLYDEMASPYFVACVDVGHAALAGREPQDSIRVLGNRLGALHIHDNDYKDDMHTLPGLSELNFDEITKALAEVGYKGDFTLETHHFFDSLTTEEETIAGLKLSVLIGRKMISMIESHKKERPYDRKKRSH